MTDFRRQYRGFRLAETRTNDTLRRFCARELGDAERWYEIASLNELRPPYLAETASEGVAAFGASLLLPASKDYIPSHIEPELVFGVDVALPRGLLDAANGDLTTVGGVPNLVQALQHVVATDIGELVFHAAYGCGARALLGGKLDATTSQLADGLVRRCVLADDRISTIQRSETRIGGDTLHVDVTAEAISGASVRVSA